MSHVVLFHVSSQVEVEPVFGLDNAHIVFPNLVCLWPWLEGPGHDELSKQPLEAIFILHLEPIFLKVLEYVFDILILALIFPVHFAEISDKRSLLPLNDHLLIVKVNFIPIPVHKNFKVFEAWSDQGS